MSALSLKAAMTRRHWHVRLVPIADSCSAAKERRYSITSSATAMDEQLKLARLPALRP
jgi:hypothetical protein